MPTPGVPAPADVPSSTLDDVERHERTRPGDWARRACVVLLLLFVVLGAAGTLGDRAATATTTVQGTEVSVTYPAVLRSGRDAPMVIRVEQPGGFAAETISIAITTGYFDSFDHQRLFPEPVGETSTDRWVVFTFDAPTGEVFEVRVDMLAEPRLQLGTATAEVGLLVDGTVTEPVSLTTTFVP